MSSSNPPSHIAIIMDGNGRWAKQRGLKRTAGHEEGARVVRNITKHCAKIGVEYLTLYAFSTENWTRPKLEVEYLMKLLEKYLKNELETFMQNSIRFKAIGDLSKFSKSFFVESPSTDFAKKYCSIDMFNVFPKRRGRVISMTSATSSAIS